MGQSVKVITKRVDSPYVHELGLVAAELEQRYKDSKVSLKASRAPAPSLPFLPHLRSPYLKVQRMPKLRAA